MRVLKNCVREREKWRKYLCDWTGSLNFMFYAPCYVWLDGCLKWPFIFIDFLFPLSTSKGFLYLSFFIWMNHYLLIQKKEKKKKSKRVWWRKCIAIQLMSLGFYNWCLIHGLLQFLSFVHLAHVKDGYSHI